MLARGRACVLLLTEHCPPLCPHPPLPRPPLPCHQVCENDCGYCGIRKHQRRARRYTMPRDEVVEVADWAFRHRLGTLMLQSGELNTPQRMKYLTDVVAAVKERTRALDAEQRLVDPEALPKDAAGVGLCVALSGGWGWGRACVSMRGVGAHVHEAGQASGHQVLAVNGLRLPPRASSRPAHIPRLPLPASRSGRAAAGAVPAAQGRGRRPIPAAHRVVQPAALRIHPPASPGTCLWPCTLSCLGQRDVLIGMHFQVLPLLAGRWCGRPSCRCSAAVQKWENRTRCLRDLKDIGFMVGPRQHPVPARMSGQDTPMPPGADKLNHCCFGGG